MSTAFAGPKTACHACVSCSGASGSGAVCSNLDDWNEASTGSTTGAGWRGADRLPTEHRASNGLDADCASLDSDHCFDGWTGTVHLHDDLLHTRITSDLRRLVVFTNDTKDFVAIEPVSHVNNAVNMLATNPQNSLASTLNAEKLGVKVLPPGESWSVQMALHTVPVP